MTPEIAKHLLLLVNTPDLYDKLCSYADYRMKFIEKQLATTLSVDDIRVLQGQHKELHRIKTLRDEVNAGAKS